MTTTNKIRGRIGRVMFRGQNGFVIVRLENGTAAKGNMPDPLVGVEYELEGEWRDHPHYGRGFSFSTYRQELPTTAAAIEEYLADHCGGIGPAVARRIVAAFGEHSLHALKNDPDRVAEAVKGLSAEKARAASEKLRAREVEEQLEIDLKTLLGGQARLSKSVIQRVRDTWGKEAPARIRANPFDLIQFRGVGFATADRVAQAVGFDRLSNARISAGIMHVLTEVAWEQGHVCLPQGELMEAAGELLGGDVSETLIDDVLEDLITTGEVIRDQELSPAPADGLCYPRAAAFDEALVANRIFELIETGIKTEQPIPIPEWMVDKNGKTVASSPEFVKGLHPDQVEAVFLALASKVFVLTGPPGTGKTFAVRRLIDALPAGRVALAAPTGKAAKRVSELAGRPAKTIHKLLEARPAEEGEGFSFTRCAALPIDADLVVIDESSMLDSWLAARLLEAVPNTARVIFIGDTYQLPSVGPGNVLKDLIYSGIVPTFELNTIKRQDPGLIVTNCHRIKDGQDIEVNNEAGSDLFFADADDETEIQHLVADLATNRLPTHYGLHPLRDIQVITATRTYTEVGAARLNEVLQARLNFAPPVEGIKYRVGDKVIQLRNDVLPSSFDPEEVEDDGAAGVGFVEVVNGDLGFVAAIYPERQSLKVAFENPERIAEIPWYTRTVKFQSVDPETGEPTEQVKTVENHLDLAYAITCHKFQGSEARCVVIPIYRGFGTKIFQRSWIYTAISRARELCVLVGQRAEARKAIARLDQHLRYTRLAERLQELDREMRDEKKEEEPAVAPAAPAGE